MIDTLLPGLAFVVVILGSAGALILIMWGASKFGDGGDD